MSHEIYTRNGIASMAYSASGGVPWHGLGQALPDNATVADYLAAAGMDFEILSAPVQYTVPVGKSATGKPITDVANYDGWVVQYRSDNGNGLGLTSRHYKVVQPKAVMEFFAEVCKRGGWAMETAGVLKGGAVYWALARVNGEASVKGDTMVPYLLLSTACDGSMSTQARRTSIRVVCSNTLGWANSMGKPDYRLYHRSKFQPKAAVDAILGQDPMGGWAEFIESGNKLAGVKVSEDEGRDLLRALLYPADVRAAVELAVKARNEVQANPESVGLDDLLSRPLKTGYRPIEIARAANERTLESMMGTVTAGVGQDTDAARGTLWGLLNGVTRHVDHERQPNNRDSAMTSAWFGQGATLKQDAHALLSSAAEVGTAAAIEGWFSKAA